jgi:TPR repeat protein
MDWENFTIVRQELYRKVNMMGRIVFSILLLSVALGAGAMQRVVKACERGSMSACEELGIRYITGDGVEENGYRALEYFRRACEAGRASACNSAAFIYADAEGGVKQDYGKAMRYWKAACAHGDGSGCSNYDLARDKLRALREGRRY